MKHLPVTAPFSALAAVLALLVAGCSAPGPTPAQRDAARARAEPGSADRLIAAALSQHFGQRNAPQALSFAASAAERAPKRADIAWLHSRLCMAVPGCEPEPLEARLRQLDPGNAAPWMGPLARAQARQDTAAEDQILEAIGQAERLDVYWNSLVSRAAMALNESAESTGENKTLTLHDQLTGSLNETVGWMSTLASNALRPVTDACGFRRTANREKALRCARVAEVLIRGDSYLVEAIGLGIAERVLTPGTAGAQAVAEQVRLSRYQRETAGQIIEGQLERARFSAEMIELMEKLRREQDVFLAVIRWAGEPLSPPKGRSF